MKEKIIRIFREISALLEASGESEERISKFLKGIDGIKSFKEPFYNYLKSGSLKNIPHIDEELAEYIKELRTNNSLEYLQHLRQQLTINYDLLFNARGINYKQIIELKKKLDIENLSDLKKACEDGSLIQLEHFNEERVSKIKKSLDFYIKYSGKYLLRPANKEFTLTSQILEEKFSEHNITNYNISPVGDLRMGRIVVRKFEVLIGLEKKDIEKVKNVIQKLYKIKSVDKNEGEPFKFSLKHLNKTLNIYLTENEYYYYYLYELTGTEEFSSLHPVEKKEYASEESVFSENGIEYIDPILREVPDIMNFKHKRRIEHPLHMEHMQGIIHIHTTYSDGFNQLEEMVEAARQKGYKYIGISDHSQRLSFVGGMDEEKILHQIDEIRELNERYDDIHIFSGVEADIFEDGTLDYPERILEKFDFVIGSIHYKFDMDYDLYTERLLKAVENPFLNIVGHPSSRKIPARDGISFDYRAVFEAAKRNHAAIELNCTPGRMDIDWHFLLDESAEGLYIAVNPDAHSVRQMKNVEYGVKVFNKSLLPPEMVINTFSLEKIKRFFKKLI